MAERVRSVKGMRDLLPPETAIWAAVEDVARRIFASYGYGEVRTPILEDTELFVRGVGEATDIVGKEMYTFTDRKGRSLTLRPESTAPVARAFVQHGLADQGLPVKLYYVGPQFRYERPQRGRYRQFNQIGAELIGDPGPASDAELLLMLVRFLEALDYTGLTVLLNTVGDDESRARYREALVAFLEPHREVLGEDSRRRLETNPLRILDTKSPAERELLADAPRLEGHLTAQSRTHFEAVGQALEVCGVRFRVEPRLVRGLDYYSRTVFEIVAEGLGAQDAIVGGGRYDGLIGDLGGADVPAIGFAIGEDRLLAALPESFRRAHAPVAPVHLVAAGDVEPSQLLELAERLRAGGLDLVTELGGRSVKAALKRADKSGSRWVLLAGEDELAAGELSLRDLDAGEQVRLGPDAAIAKIKGQS
ncbi:MAG: histidine--tRNA ligase [Acidobacteria bacterium]|nr:histidine--tRNA ligase [Acidobacteriota bacterium]